MRWRIIGWSKHADDTTIFFAVTQLQALYRRNKSSKFVEQKFGWRSFKRAEFERKKEVLKRRLDQDRLVQRLAFENQERAKEKQSKAKQKGNKLRVPK